MSGNIGLLSKHAFINIARSSRCIVDGRLGASRILGIHRLSQPVQMSFPRFIFDKRTHIFYEKDGAEVPDEHEGMLSFNKAVKRPINAPKGITLKLDGCVTQLRKTDIFFVKDSKTFPSNWEEVSAEERINILKSDNVLATSYCHYFKSNADYVNFNTHEDEKESSTTLDQDVDILETYKEKLQKVTIVIEDRWQEHPEWNEILETIQRDSMLLEYSRSFIINALLEFLSLANCEYRDNIDVSAHLQSNAMLSLVDFAANDHNRRLSHRGLAQYIHELKKYNLHEFAYEDVYKKYIKKKSPVLSPQLQATIFDLITNTEHWKEAIPLIQHINVHTPKERTLFRNILCAAIKFGNYEDVMSFYEMMIENNILLTSSIILELVKYLSVPSDNEYWERNNAFVMGLFAYMGKHRIFPTSEEVAIGIAEWFKNDKENKWKASFSTSASLRNTLNYTSISDQQCYELAGHIFHKILGKTDTVPVAVPDERIKHSKKLKVMTRTSPHELAEYKDFLFANGPYDVIVDGLNIFYALTLHWEGKRIDKKKKLTFKQNVEVLNKMDSYVDEAIQFIAPGKEDLRFLIIFRHHMRALLEQSHLHERSNVDVYLTSNTTHDDHFSTIAALLSGRNCKVISNDLFRNSKQSSGKEYGQLFYDWQRINQYNFALPHRHKPMRFIQPYPYHVAVQNIRGNWFIPYFIDKSEVLPKHWVIVSKEQKAKFTDKTTKDSKFRDIIHRTRT